MKLALFIFVTVFHCQNAYKIVTLPKADEDHHSMKVFFSTKMVHKTQLTTTTVTETAFETCYAAEPGKVLQKKSCTHSCTYGGKSQSQNL